MFACAGCRRFVREQTTACPFCGQANSEARAPFGGFLGVLLGVSLAACGADDGGTASDSNGSTATTQTSSGDTSAGSMSASSTMGTTAGTDTTNESSGIMTSALYGPVTDDSGPVDTSSSGGTDDSTGTDGSTGTGDSTTGDSSTVGPLYGPATG